METEQVLGVDRSVAFSDVELKVLKDDYKVQAIGFYLGGPFYSIKGWSKSDIDRTVAAGFHIMPIYVGQNAVKGSTPPVLTDTQAIKDAEESLTLLADFGYADPKDINIVLDMESSTFEYDQENSAKYADQWCNTIAMHGAIPGVYSSLGFFSKMIETGRPPGFMWLADWRAKGIDDSLKLSDMPGVPPTIFIDHQRNWQYAGNISFSGLTSPVDIDLFDITRLIKVETTEEIKPVVTEPVPVSTSIDKEGVINYIAAANQALAEATKLLNS